MEQIILLGGGGHAGSVIDSIIQLNLFDIAGIIECKNSKETRALGFPVIGTDEDLKAVYDSGIKNAFVTVGYLGKSSVRERLYNNLKQIGYKIPPIIDPSAILASDIQIKEGAYVGKGAIINANSQIGKMCIINTGAIVEHDNEIGDFSHIAVGSVLCGNVKTGRKTLIGANATVIQSVSIGESAIIGAGVTVRHDVKAGQIYYGR